MKLQKKILIMILLGGALALPSICETIDVKPGNKDGLALDFLGRPNLSETNLTTVGFSISSPDPAFLEAGQRHMQLRLISQSNVVASVWCEWSGMYGTQFATTNWFATRNTRMNPRYLPSSQVILRTGGDPKKPTVFRFLLDDWFTQENTTNKLLQATRKLATEE